jgi:hypothetical protein
MARFLTPILPAPRQPRRRDRRRRGTVDTLQQVELMTDEQILSKFGTSEDPATRGFDEATYARVLAYELVRARDRLAFYRTLYATFIAEGKPYMVENLDESEDGDAVPAKLVFSEDPDHVGGLEESGDVVVWTEPALLEALERERGVHDFFAELLEELEPAVLAD